MGYPTRRVPMNSVHGEPQQGAALPSEIWRTYMSAVTEGHSCAPLHESSSGISFQPFYGKYAATGQATSERESSESSKPHKSGKPKQKSAPGPAPPAQHHTPPGQTPPPIDQTGGAGPG